MYPPQYVYIVQTPNEMPRVFGKSLDAYVWLGRFGGTITKARYVL